MAMSFPCHVAEEVHCGLGRHLSLKVQGRAADNEELQSCGRQESRWGSIYALGDGSVL